MEWIAPPKERLLTAHSSLLELSPEFKLMGQIDANFGQDSVNAVVDLNYNLTGLSFIFPPQGSESDGFTSDAKRESCLRIITMLSCPN